MIRRYPSIGTFSKVLGTTLLTCLIASCSDGDAVLGPENDPQFSGGGQTFTPDIPDILDGDASAEVFQYGIVSALKDLPNAQESIVTASFLGFQQQVLRPDPEEEAASFIEACVIDDPVEDPIFTFLSGVDVTVGGNIEAGAELFLKDSSNTDLLIMNKVTTDESVGYVGRIPASNIVPESLRINVPGGEFPAFDSVIIPRVDKIEDFQPLPGVVVTKDSAFTWTAMEAVPDQSPPVVELSIMSDDFVINCTTFDDGAFTITDAAALFDIDEIEGGVLSTVSRRTRYDTIASETHVIGLNMTFIGIERIVEEEEKEVFSSEYVGAEVATGPPALEDPVAFEISQAYPTSSISDFDDLGCEGLIHRIDIPAGRDALITMVPGENGAIEYPLWVTGGRNVHIRGLEFRTVVQPGCDVGEAHQVGNDIPNIHPRLPGSKVLRFQQSGTTYIEGVDIDLQGQEADCFVMRNPTGTTPAQALIDRKVHIVNTRCVGIEGLDSSPIGDGIHGDFFQNQGSDNLGEFIVDTSTYKTSSNGITLHKWNGVVPDIFSMRRINYGWDDRYDDDSIYEISGLAFTGHGNQVEFESVYLDDPRGLNYGIMNDERVGAFELPGFIRKVDGLREGLSPIGDFAPEQLTGLEYVSPFVDVL